MTEQSDVVIHDVDIDLAKLYKEFNKEFREESIELDISKLNVPDTQKYFQDLLNERVDNYVMELRLACNSGLAVIVSSDGSLKNTKYRMKGIPEKCCK